MDLQLPNQEIDFPVSFKLKIISEAYDSNSAAEEKFGKILKKHGVSSGSWSTVASSGGKYTSFRVDVTINDHDTMRKLYSDLGACAGVKCVL